MKSSEKFERVFGHLGSISFEESPNKIIYNVDFYEPIAGVEKFVFTFTRSNKNKWHRPEAREQSLDQSNRTVVFKVSISRHERNFRRACDEFVVRHVRFQVKGNSTENKAFELLSAVAAADPYIEIPEYPEDLKRYDFFVNVKSSRSHGKESIPVPVQIKSGPESQAEHIRKYPKIPSIMIRQGVDLKGLIEPTRNLLHSYVDEGKVFHI